MQYTESILNEYSLLSKSLGCFVALEMFICQRNIKLLNQFFQNVFLNVVSVLYIRKFKCQIVSTHRMKCCSLPIYNLYNIFDKCISEYHNCFIHFLLIYLFLYLATLHGEQHPVCAGCLQAGPS